MSNSQCLGYSPQRIRAFSDQLGEISSCLYEIESLLGYDEWSGENINRQKLTEFQKQLKSELSDFIREHGCFIVSLSSLDEAKQWKDWAAKASSLGKAFDVNAPPSWAKNLVATRIQAGTWQRSITRKYNRMNHVTSHIWQNRLPYSISFILGFLTNLLTSLIF